MGSKTLDGVWFSAFSDDHPPPHVHGKLGRVEVVIDLLPDGKIRKSSRRKAVKLRGGKRSDARRILSVAAANAVVLMELWESMHGKAS